MKRYVNFMSNPDERTAIDQFGTGDKCFGVAVLMSTLPGLPMFGHGQIEGYTEKYGMEYRWPRYEETPDQWLVERHDREIAPLLKKRWLFAESNNFLLYDFFTPSGNVDENVFAYSNRNGIERALVIYNNRYGTTHGTVDYSAAYADKGAGGLRQQRLREGLGLGNDGYKILAFRDSLTGLEYLRRADEVLNGGFTLDLNAYQCHVFVDWRELQPTADHPWDRLCDYLHGRGMRNLDDALVGLELQSVHDALRRLLDPTLVRQFADLAEQPRAWVLDKARPGEGERNEFFDEAWRRCEAFLRAAQATYLSRLPKEQQPKAENLPADPGLLMQAFRQRLRAAMRIPSMETLFPKPWTSAARRMLPSPSPQFTATAMWGPILGWCALELLSESINVKEPERVALDLYDRLRLREPFGEAFGALGFEGEESWRVAARIKVVLLTGAGVGKETPAPEAKSAEPESATAAAKTPETATAAPVADANVSSPTVDTEKVALAPALWQDPDVGWLTGLHEAEGHFYMVREQYEELLWWLLMPSLLSLAADAVPSRESIAVLSRTLDEALETAEAAGYRMDLLLGTQPEVEVAAYEDVPDEEPTVTSARGTEVDDEELFKDSQKPNGKPRK